jgi:hypothetical protein
MMVSTIYILLSIGNQILLLLCLEKTQILPQRQTSLVSLFCSVVI